MYKNIVLSGFLLIGGSLLAQQTQINGSVTVVGSGDLYIGGGMVIGSTGTLDMKEQSTLISRGSVTNGGTLSFGAASSLDTDDGSFPLSNTIGLKDITLGSSGTINLNQNARLTVSNAVTNNGTFNIENGAQLIQTSGTDLNTGTGTFSVKRQGTSDTQKYNSWSSPVESASILGVMSSTNACDIYAFDENVQQWKYDYPLGFSTTCNGTPVAFTSNYILTGGDGNFDPGRGYFVPGNNSPLKDFTGQVNNGDVVVPVKLGVNPGGVNWTGDNWNMIGNPYPSGLDAADFLADNSAVIFGSIYYWVHPSTQSGAQDDYMVWNNVGVINNYSHSGITSINYIPSMQGFFVEAKVNGNVTFNNSHRSAPTNNTFYKAAPVKGTRIWLSVQTMENKRTQALLGFLDDATEFRDGSYDARWNPSGGLAIYSVNNDTAYSIQALPSIEEMNEREIPLGIDVDYTGAVVIHADSVTEFGTEDELILEDRELQKFTNLRSEPYVVYVESGRMLDRFFLHIKNKVPSSDVATSTEEVEIEGVKVWNFDKVLYAQSEDKNDPITQINLVNLTGELVFSQSANSSFLTLSDIDIASGIYVVSLKTLNKERHFKIKW